MFLEKFMMAISRSYSKDEDAIDNKATSNKYKGKYEKQCMLSYRSIVKSVFIF